MDNKERNFAGVINLPSGECPIRAYVQKEGMEETFKYCYINRYNMEIKQILRYPRLDTVLMVEKKIEKFDGEFKKRALWENLPKKMMYQTFCVVIDYLLYSRKISIDSEGKIGWIYYPENKDEHIKNKSLFWSK